MKTPKCTRLLAATVAVTILGATIPQGAALTPGPPTASASEPLEDAPVINGADPELTAVIEAAIERFNTAGLTLPALHVYVHPTRDGCRGAAGLFGRDESWDRIDLCTRVKWTILHELAHAWEHHTMSDATRRAFLDHTGLEAWHGYGDLDWEDRGIEAAAQAIAWGLLDTAIANPAAFGQQLHQFELLTGISSPRLPDPSNDSERISAHIRYSELITFDWRGR